jgi:hypothetical protein
MNMAINARVVLDPFAFPQCALRETLTNKRLSTCGAPPISCISSSSL